MVFHVSVRWGLCGELALHSVGGERWPAGSAAGPIRLRYQRPAELIPYELGGTVDLVHFTRRSPLQTCFPAHWLSSSNPAIERATDVGRHVQ